jgi:hypothetical protein
LASTDPNPTQATLDAVLGRATRVRLLDYRIDGNRVYQFDVVRLDTSDPASLTELRGCLRIIEDPKSFGHLLTIGDHRLELMAGDEQLATLEVLCWVAVRWPSVWKHDAWLADPRRFETWLTSRGVPDAQHRREADERRKAERRAAVARWEHAMPPCLRTLWPERLGDMNPDIAAARELLAVAVPDPVERVRVLYEWFGSGAGPWSGFPAYEAVPERLLREYPVQTLIDAVSTQTTTEAGLLGAARLFADWNFGRSRRADRSRCPEALRTRMLVRVEQQGISDNLERFRRAFE